MGRKFKIKKGVHYYSPDKLIESFKVETVGDATMDHEISCADEDKMERGDTDQIEQEVVNINL